MANKKIIDVDKLSSLTDSDSLFVNAGGELKQISVDDTKLTRMELVWENASPTAEFAAQTITLNKTDDLYLVWARDHTSYEEDLVVITSSGGRFMYTSGAGSANINYYTRIFRITDNKISFEDCYGKKMNATSAGSTSNAYFIPYKIYIIKGV